MATIREVSKFANVSVATVSRVINGNKWVSDATRDKVLAAMKELGYKPNSFARSLATNKSHTIGMVIGDLSGPFFGKLMNEAEQEIRNAGKHLIITSGHDTVESERDAIDFLLQRRVDALILHLDVLPDQDIIDIADNSGVPLILVNRLVPELINSSISLDNELGGYLAVKHLTDLGHTQIATITGPLYKADARARLSGYRRALEEAGIAYDERLVVESDFQEEGGIAPVERLYRRKVKFSALFIQNDHMAFGAMNTLKGRGVNIPEEVSIVGYDDMVMARYVEPALTTVAVPVAEFGKLSAQMALKLSANEPADVQNLRFVPELVVRSSTAPYRKK
ncbi:LacI family DNA-binding transcriptional regulator [Reinekea marinisedimentorum]|uniref:LacI family transcriptional regulator n=1 Tax=Reinekea marinisedimentorum TaxID=230495 RepID=A0A4R3IDT3_9GAMM|nr:LacI family DNA-binding transcriptional regulator [Reinekea marinisedimentorum]TCS43936.1 LacI family transcriptional regulator [Reinekea marinisedimentorum]